MGFEINIQGRMVERLHGRMSAVIIECLPWAEVLERYDRATALFYLDPPYWGCTRGGRQGRQ